MSISILALLVCLTIVTVGQGMASCEGHLDGCPSVGDLVSTTSQSLLQRKRIMLNKIRGDENETEGSSQAGGVMGDPMDVPSKQAGMADASISKNHDKADEDNDEKDGEKRDDDNDDNDEDNDEDTDMDDNDDNANNNNHVKIGDGEGMEDPSHQFKKDVRKAARKFVNAMTESEDHEGGKFGHLQGKPSVAANDSAAEDSQNYLCIDEGKVFATAKAANNYFMKECLGVYEYNTDLCTGLSDKVFEQWRADMSEPWKPDQDVCDEIDSLLRADIARRHEMGLPVVVAPEPAAMLERSNRSSSASSSSTLDEVMRYKPNSPASPPAPAR